MIVCWTVLAQSPRKLSHVQIPEHVREFVAQVYVHVLIESPDKSKEILETTAYNGTLPFRPPSILQNTGKGRPQTPCDNEDG
jgi:hypothetical protein